MEATLSGSYRCKEEKQKTILTGHDPEENQRLFDLYIRPNFDRIKALTIRYTNNNSNVEEDYWYVLCEFYKYIYSYNPEASLNTWLHIVVKRTVQDLNKKRYTTFSHYTSTPRVPLITAMSDGVYEDNYFENDPLMMGFNDEIVKVLKLLPPLKLSAFLLQVQGRSIKEITDIEFARHHLTKYSQEVIKSRIFFCRSFLRKRLTKDGKLRNQAEED